LAGKAADPVDIIVGQQHDVLAGDVLG
jgi:hypothetical protein